MNEIKETSKKEEENEIKELNINGKIYNVNCYIEKDKIVVEIESDSGKYSNQYVLEQLQKFKVFKMSEDINEALNDLKEMFDGVVLIEEKNNSLDIALPHKKGDVKFLLTEIDDKVDITYDNLSSKMKEKIDNNELVLGIDLGTTFSCASVMIDKYIIVIRNSLGSTTTPSFIAFINKEEAYVGELSKLLPSNAKNIIYNTKRLIGKNFEDTEIQELMQNLSFKLINEEESHLLKIKLNFNNEKDEKSVKSKKSDKKKSKKKKEKKEEEEKENEEEINDEFYPEQICSLILKKIVKDSEFYLSQKIGKNIEIKNCVITVPAYFNQKQREATLNSAKIIGLNVKTMINEPTAASLAYGYKSKGNADKNIIVIDFGGGTLDITLLRYRKDENAIYCDVKETYGDTHFGGEDFDKILMAKCKEECLRIDSGATDSLIYREKFHGIRLKRACERAKIKLSKMNETQIHLENYIQYKTFDFKITKDKFIEYCQDLFKKFEKILNDFMVKSGMNKNNIHEVILIGGSTLIPKIKEIIRNKFNNSKINDHLDPKEVVAMGACIRGAKFLDLPSVKDIKLFDVTNLSLGIREANDKFARIIKRSSKIPCGNTQRFKTFKDNQVTVLVEIFEGEGEEKCNENNLLLDKFKIHGLPKKKAGEVKIEVNFQIKDNSILEVKAWEKDNKENKNEIKIKKLYDLDIEFLGHMINQISFVDNIDYNNIKFSIIESEEKIVELKNKKHPDKEGIKDSNKFILGKIGEFLAKINVHSNLYISFIKYYFNKICEYYQFFDSKKNDDLNDFNNIKENVKMIFEKIYFINPDLIFEIIEEFVDQDELYKSFIDFILKSYWDKINLIFYQSAPILKDKNNKMYSKALLEFEEAEKLSDICIQLLDKFNLNQNNSNYITIKDLKNLKLKIKVRKEIIKSRSKGFFKRLFSSSNTDELNILYDDYSKSESIDKDDLQELKTIIGKKETANTNEQNNEDFERDFEKGQIFMEWLNAVMYDIVDREIPNIFTRILTDFPYCKKEDEDRMWDDFHVYKSKEMTLDDYLIKIKGCYENLLYDESISDIKKEIYNMIFMFLNSL